MIKKTAGNQNFSGFIFSCLFQLKARSI